MTSDNIGGLPGFEAVCEGAPRRVGGVYCADLLSWAMSRAPEGCAWCTVMGSVNTVAVAVLADVGAVVLCEGARFDGDALRKARENGVNLFATALPAFEAGVAIARAAALHGLAP